MSLIRLMSDYSRYFAQFNEMFYRSIYSNIQVHGKKSVKAQFSRQFMKDLDKRDYELKPIKLGCEIRGIDLKKEVKPEVVSHLKDDILKHRLLVFKNQGIIRGDRHAEISKWFGEIESTFEKHPKCEHPDVFRVANDPKEGCTGVGFTGWHIDGTFNEVPFLFALYHMVNIPKNGATFFAPLTDLIDRLPRWKKEEWDKLWMISDRKSKPIHPFIFRHPLTRKEVLCLHPGMTSGFIYNYGTEQEKRVSQEDYRRIIMEIHEEFTRNGGDIQYKHEWEFGDFVVADNLAVAHKATGASQLPPNRVGLRVLHRTTIKGVERPRK